MMGMCSFLVLEVGYLRIAGLKGVHQVAGLFCLMYSLKYVVGYCELQEAGVDGPLGSSTGAHLNVLLVMVGLWH